MKSRRAIKCYSTRSRRDVRVICGVNGECGCKIESLSIVICKERESTRDKTGVNVLEIGGYLCWSGSTKVKEANCIVYRG